MLYSHSMTRCSSSAFHWCNIEVSVVKLYVGLLHLVVVHCRFIQRLNNTVVMTHVLSERSCTKLIPTAISRLAKPKSSSSAVTRTASKTQIIVFGSHQNIRRLPPVTVNFGGVSLVPCTEVKNLGVIFDRCLSWDSHVAQLTRRCFGTLTGLAHLRHHVPAHVVEMLVTALVLSQVRYCISVYGNGSGGNLNRIQKIINFAVRVVFGRSKYDHVSDLRQRLGWMSSDELVQYHTLRLLHKVLRDGEPECLANMYQTNRSRRERSTRQDLQLHVPASRTNAGKRCFYRRAPALYNSLPPGTDRTICQKI